MCSVWRRLYSNLHGRINLVVEMSVEMLVLSCTEDDCIPLIAIPLFPCLTCYTVYSWHSLAHCCKAVTFIPGLAFGDASAWPLIAVFVITKQAPMIGFKNLGWADEESVVLCSGCQLMEILLTIDYACNITWSPTTKNSHTNKISIVPDSANTNTSLRFKGILMRICNMTLPGTLVLHMPPESV